MELINGLSSHANLTSPDIPQIPGMTVDTRYQPELPLNPVGIYLTAIKLMYNLVQEDWNQPVPRNGGSWVDGYNVKIVVLRSKGGNLHYSHIISALREVMNDLSSKKSFCQLVTQIFLDGKEIGLIFLLPKDERTINATGKETSDTNFKDTANNATTLLSTDEIIDPDFTHIKITYHIDGSSIPSRSIFLMVLDGMARVAQFDGRASCSVIHAWDPDLNAVFHMGAADERRFPLRYNMITRSLYLLFGDILLDKSRFHEMYFHLLWDGQRVAQGSVTSLPLPPEVQSLGSVQTE